MVLFLSGTLTSFPPSFSTVTLPLASCASIRSARTSIQSLFTPAPAPPYRNGQSRGTRATAVIACMHTPCASSPQCVPLPVPSLKRQKNFARASAAIHAHLPQHLHRRARLSPLSTVSRSRPSWHHCRPIQSTQPQSCGFCFHFFFFTHTHTRGDFKPASETRGRRVRSHLPRLPTHPHLPPTLPCLPKKKRETGR